MSVTNPTYPVLMDATKQAEFETQGICAVLDAASTHDPATTPLGSDFIEEGVDDSLDQRMSGAGSFGYSIYQVFLCRCGHRLPYAHPNRKDDTNQM